MIKELYVVFDQCADSYSLFGEFVNDACAIRRFNDLVSNESSPADFMLFNVGSYDTVTGRLNPVDIKFVVRGEKVVS